MKIKTSQSFWNRAGSFDAALRYQISESMLVSIPLEQGRVFRQYWSWYRSLEERSQSLWNRAGSFDTCVNLEDENRKPSQSLWNRAGSFDLLFISSIKVLISLNPFGTGQGLSTMKQAISLNHLLNVSIPLEQGRVFRPDSQALNRLGLVSIPLEQGRVFRPIQQIVMEMAQKSQSLWNRAGSFDAIKICIFFERY